MGGDSCRGFESQHHILDGHFSHLFVAKFVMLAVCKNLCGYFSGNFWKY